MARYLYVSPVGTSLLQNFARSPRYRGIVERYRDRGIEEWYRLSLDDPRNRPPDGYVCQVVRGHELYEAMTSFAREDPRRASAELAGLLGIAELFGHSHGDAEVLLFYTNSCNSILCSDIVAETLKSMGFASVQRIGIRAARSVDDFEEGLIEVLDRVVKIMVNRKRAGYRVYVNATPGFKAETTFFVIASLLAGADAVIYMHESFRTPIILPAPPITLDRAEIEKLTKAFGNQVELPLSTLYTLGITEDQIVYYRDRGVLEIRHGIAKLRTWIRKLLEIYTQ